MLLRRMLIALAMAAALWLIADMALACPTCKDQLAHDPEAANIVRGYFWSILFMLSMPYLILAGLGGYFYWEVRKARARLAAERAGAGEIAGQAPDFTQAPPYVPGLVEAG